MSYTNPWKYKVFARRLLDRDYYEAGIMVYNDRDRQLTDIREQYGPNWELWIERFPREHPHAALQRRLNAREIHARAMANAGRPKKDGDLKLTDLVIRHHEREAVNDAIARPSSLKTESPAAPATTEPPSEESRAAS